MIETRPMPPFHAPAMRRIPSRVYNLFDKVYAVSGDAVNGIGNKWQLGRPLSAEVTYTVA
ncbi:iron complex outermembrane recepter protein [Methylobacterium sp. UNC300MFChir4.1]|uniref:hypothetical protein n=1 Tax=Methylobacterium sp. UNC300MFChir4.1 TaxID=1502747 RepID=UPI0008BF5633|nr:hypothetical protein [Methylobacterium sp. UNC300MFChir4.1]SEP30431.1 iron complex outermembrane recepter protein [Methylobacterium sp. UNC300MFChir4.1]